MATEVFPSHTQYSGYFLPVCAVESGSFLTRAVHPEYGEGWLLFRDPIETKVARKVEEVRGLLQSVSEMGQSGRFAAGYLAYEASPAFDPAFEVRSGGHVPLAVFQIYEGASEFYKELEPAFDSGKLEWEIGIEQTDFLRRFNEIKKLIAEGVTYQVNFSFRLKAPHREVSKLLWRIAADDPPPYASLFNSAEIQLASLSPELFFERAQSRVRCRPMKGTIRRGENQSEDLQRLGELRTSAKDRAENLMVVDMIRNDLGRIAEIGSVTTHDLFEIETYPTVFQMTSTVEALVNRRLEDTFAALFPCASIVGAPKVSTMREIARLETSPRGAYTGAIGWVGPSDQARFSVAIRTLSTVGENGDLSYGVGSGIVWDSDGEAEWRECLLKGEILERSAHPWGLVETTRWTEQEGFWLLEKHLERMGKSATELGIPFDRPVILSKLAAFATGLAVPSRVRFVLGYRGEIEIGSTPLSDQGPVLQARLASTPISSKDPSLRFKTTWRRLYERHIRGVDEALLWNEKEEITEFCNGNVVALLEGKMLTPPLECGLLPGTMRAHLLHLGEIEEQVIRLSDLSRVEALYRINSVRGRQLVELTDGPSI